MTIQSEKKMGCAADFGPSAAGTRLANHTAAEGGMPMCAPAPAEASPPVPPGVAFPFVRGETPAGTEIELTLRTRSGVGSVSVTGRTAVPAAA